MAVAVIARPPLEDRRLALVLAEDRIGHYPEFRRFFARAPQAAQARRLPANGESIRRCRRESRRPG